nr:hypothetical protein HmN_000066600 [Hymenolepis microstoma]
MFSEKHSLEVNNDSDSSSSITIGNGTADSILKKLRKSRIQEQKNKSDKTLLDSKKGTDDSDTKPMITLTVPKPDSVESIFNDQGDNSCVHVTKGPTFKSNLYNGPSLLPASNSKLGFVEQESGDIIFTAYILMKSARQDEYEMLKKVSQHRIRGLEKQQNFSLEDRVVSSVAATNAGELHSLTFTSSCALKVKHRSLTMVSVLVNVSMQPLILSKED